MEHDKSKHDDSFLACCAKFGVLPTIRTRLRGALIWLRHQYLVKFWGMDIHPDTLISLKAILDRTHPKGIHIGECTAISFGTIVFTHDMTRTLYADTYVGRYCQIGANSVIMPGVKIGDHCVVGSASVVTKDVPAHSIVVGNPARVIRKNIMTTRWGKITDRGESV